MGQVARRGCLEVDGLGGRRDGGEGGVRWAGLAPSCGVWKERSGAMTGGEPLQDAHPGLHRPALGIGSHHPFRLGATWTEADEPMAWTQTGLPGGGGGQGGSEAGGGGVPGNPKGRAGQRRVGRTGDSEMGGYKEGKWAEEAVGAPPSPPDPRGPPSASVAHSPHPSGWASTRQFLRLFLDGCPRETGLKLAEKPCCSQRSRPRP